jgi:hypothetical protein
MRTVFWGALMTAMTLCVSCPANSLLTDMQAKVEQAKAASMQTVATPVFTPAANTFGTDQSVTITDTTPGAKIYYTSETGSSTPPNPTSSSTMYSVPIVVAGNGTTMTIKAIAMNSDMNNSVVATSTYTINYNQIPPPVFTPSAGSYSANQLVTITDATAGAMIYYTTNGTTPTTSSTVYSGAISVVGNGTNETIEALATKSGMLNSSVVTAAYMINYTQVATPQFTPSTGTYSADQSVTITDATAGATIYYTTNGTTPTTSSIVYSGAISVAGNGTNETIEALATKSGMLNSSVVTAAYTINYTKTSTPQFSPTAGTYTSAQTVTLSSATPGAYINYTTNGTTPAASGGSLSPVTVSVSASETIEAIAYESGWTNSTVASAAYTITGTVATPTFSPGAGTYTSAQTVTISSTTPGAYINYTTNGTTPTSSGGSPSPVTVTVSASETVEAIAYESGWINSTVASATYILPVATPTFSPGAGTYTSAQTVTISSTTPGAYINYTTNGTTPAASGGSPSPVTVTVSASETVEAIAYESGWVNSTVPSAAYIITGTVVTPTFSPVAGTYTSAQTVTISSTTPGAYINYTTNGTTPAASGGSPSPVTVTVSASETVEAIAFESGWVNSTVSSAFYTIPGSTWTARTLPSSAGCGSVTYGDNEFVAVAYNSSTAATSPDGITWTVRTLPSSAAWDSVTYGNNEFVTVADPSLTADTSPDGITWTARTLPSSADWISVTYGNNEFVTVAQYGTAAATSPDGITWTAQTLPSSASWVSVTYGNGEFVAIATGSTVAATSSDGITWTAQTLPSSASWVSVTYGNGEFVAIATGSTAAATSSDGITWTARTLPSSANWDSVTYGYGEFVAVASSGTVAATSSDGITWTARTLPSSAFWASVTFGNNKFVAVANGSTAAATSP